MIILPNFLMLSTRKLRHICREAGLPFPGPVLSVDFTTSKTQGLPPGIGEVVFKQEKTDLFPKDRSEWNQDLVSSPGHALGDIWSLR